jgi:hypothetical protein
MATREQLDELRKEADLYRQTFSAYAKASKTQPQVQIEKPDIIQKLKVEEKPKQPKKEHVKKEEAPVQKPKKKRQITKAKA